MIGKDIKRKVYINYNIIPQESSNLHKDKTKQEQCEVIFLLSPLEIWRE